MATDYVVGTGPGLGALAFRLTDADNFLLLETNGSNLQFYRQQGGVWTLVASQPLPALTAGSTHRLEVHAVGSSVQGWWDGVQVLQVTETFQQTATRHGLDWNSAYDATTRLRQLHAHQWRRAAAAATGRHAGDGDAESGERERERQWRGDGAGV